MKIELDGVVGLGEVEAAAMAFAREAPAQLVAVAVESMIADLVDSVVGPFGVPLADGDQLEAPWRCTGCASRRGFRRRGFRPKPRTVTTACGKVAFASQQLECRSCERRFAPAAELLGLGPHQRRTEALSKLAASLAVEVAYAKASRLLAELAGPAVSARSIRRDVIAMALPRIGPARAAYADLIDDAEGCGAMAAAGVWLTRVGLGGACPQGGSERRRSCHRSLSSWSGRARLAATIREITKPSQDAPRLGWRSHGGAVGEVEQGAQ